MDSSHTATLYLPGLRKQVKQIQIYPKVKTSPLISLEVLYDDGRNIEIYKQ